MWTILLLVIGILLVIAVFVYIAFLRNSSEELPSGLKTNNPLIDTSGFVHGLADIKVEIQDIKLIKDELAKVIVGLDSLINAIIINLFAWWHVLVEWLPWLAKTKAIHSFAQVMQLEFSRIQFTPDMLPSDIIGVDIYDSRVKSFKTNLWPIFSNIILADEINRTPPKVQSALLEAMQEKQVTIWGNTIKLPVPFLVLATQNPIEQEGTYPLPEAQIDRFLFKISVDYPTHENEIKVLDIMENSKDSVLKKHLTHHKFLSFQKDIEKVLISHSMKNYITSLVQRTRQKHKYLIYGASPRASIALMKASKVVAFLSGRSVVESSDIQKIYLPVLRHRILLNYQAKIDEVSADTILLELAGQIDPEA